jgi:hypothetical protein
MILPSERLSATPTQTVHCVTPAVAFLAWGNPDRIRSAERQGHPFEGLNLDNGLSTSGFLLLSDILA